MIGALDPRHFDRDFALTNRLRTKGTDHLLSAGQAMGVRRFVAQSYGAWWYVRTGGPVKSEEDPLDPTPAREMRDSWAAVRHLEQGVLGAQWTEGIVLRYGGFYGPGTSLAPSAEQGELVRRRKFPLVGDGGGVRSFIHVADAAEATVAAVSGDRGDRRQERGQRAPARHPRQTPRRAAPAPASKRRASSATSWQPGSSRPSSTWS